MLAGKRTSRGAQRKPYWVALAGHRAFYAQQRPDGSLLVVPTRRCRSRAFAKAQRALWAVQVGGSAVEMPDAHPARSLWPQSAARGTR